METQVATIKIANLPDKLLCKTLYWLELVA